MSNIIEDNADFVVRHAASHAGENAFGGHEKLFTEAIALLQEQSAGDAATIATYQKWLRAANFRANKYRRQRNGFAVILGVAIVKGYLLYREEMKKPLDEDSRKGI